jgi:probable F420-dependent oxidoreductase
MQVGVHLPHFGADLSSSNLKRFAQRAEALGFDSVWASDHIASPAEIESSYPYTADGKWPGDHLMPRLEALGTLHFIAGCTERVRLGTSVMVLGYRPPIQSAKLWATLDYVSEGRAILGVGVGWMREEFEALGMPSDHRGGRGDEQLEIFEALFRQPTPSYAGRFYDFPAVGFEPKPPQGHIPVWVGGGTPAAMRRAARYGDAWHAAFASPLELEEQWVAVRGACEALGRDPTTMELTVRLRVDWGGDVGYPNALTGSAEAIVEGLGPYVALGVSHVLLDIVAEGGIDGRIEALQRLAEDVRPHLP